MVLSQSEELDLWKHMFLSKNGGELDLLEHMVLSVFEELGIGERMVLSQSEEVDLWGHMVLSKNDKLRLVGTLGLS